jgi:hypothetical protein
MMMFMIILLWANVVACHMSPCYGLLRRRCHTSVTACDGLNVQFRLTRPRSNARGGLRHGGPAPCSNARPGHSLESPSSGNTWGGAGEVPDGSGPCAAKRRWALMVLQERPPMTAATNGEPDVTSPIRHSQAQPRIPHPLANHSARSRSFARSAARSETPG